MSLTFRDYKNYNQIDKKLATVPYLHSDLLFNQESQYRFKYELTFILVFDHYSNHLYRKDLIYWKI